MTTLSNPRTTFAVPDALFAPEPAEQRGLSRSGVRLLVARPDGIEHTRFDRIGDQLQPGDVLVINNSQTVPAQFDAESERLGPVLVHLGGRLPNGDRLVELRSVPLAARSILDGRVHDRLVLPGDAVVELTAPLLDGGSSPTGQGNRLWRARLQLDGPMLDYRYRYGRPISYGYLRQPFGIESYQTVFGIRPGSVEMPSAGRPFTAALTTALVAAGIQFAAITLHTGFSSTEANEGPQAEWFEVDPSAARTINAARVAGRRVIAVGTTATRAVESATGPDRVVRPSRGWTELVISERHPVRVTSGLITGWHDPAASHLLLVESVGGAGLTQRAYDAAVGEQYRWHEFGDSCLLLP